MTFQSWFEQSEFALRGGKKRFCVRANVVHATLMKALAGNPLEPKAASRIAKQTGGAVDAASLSFPGSADKKRKRKAA